MAENTATKKVPLKQFLSLPPSTYVFLLAPVLLIGLSIYLFKSYANQSRLNQIVQQYIHQQNQILTFDVQEVAQGVSDLLEKAARDTQILSLIPVTEDAFRKFYLAQGGNFVHFDEFAKSDGKTSPLLFYNRLMFLENSGKVRMHLYQGKRDTTVKTVEDCLEKDLCDKSLLRRAFTLPSGELEYGKIMRWYTPRGESPQDEGASLGIAYRSSQGIYYLGIDYRHIKDHMTTPAFPYVQKLDLLQAYDHGNYIYIVDSGTNIIAHPKIWHVYGVDRKTGMPVTPMKVDADEGSHPINLLAYQSGRLKAVFQRMLSHSFLLNGVDIFRGQNLRGDIRVLSIAPIQINKGQFRQSSIFGHIILGCALDYFQEPEPRSAAYE